MTLNDQLKALIIERYGSLKKFSEVIGLKYTTLHNLLNHDIGKASVTHCIAICQELGISTDALAQGKIEPRQNIDVNIQLLQGMIKSDTLKRNNGEHLLEYQKKFLNKALDVLEDDNE